MRIKIEFVSQLWCISTIFQNIICPPSQLFRLLEELSNIIYYCLLTLTVVQNQLNVSHFVIQYQLLPSHSLEIPCRPSEGVPSERLRLVKRFISHRLFTGAWVNLVLLTYLLTYIGNNFYFYCGFMFYIILKIFHKSLKWSYKNIHKMRLTSFCTIFSACLLCLSA